MNQTNDILETTVGSVVMLVAVGAVFRWAVRNDPNGPFSPLLDSTATISSWVLNPSVTLLVLAVSGVFAAWSYDRF
jgi:hypothetical protein